MVRQAIKEGIVKPHEVDMVQKLRALRNLCSHFNPNEKTLAEFQTAVDTLEMERPVSFSNLEIVAKVALTRTSVLLEEWKKRIAI